MSTGTKLDRNTSLLTSNTNLPSRCCSWRAQF